jgi:hypothetical protein
LRKLAAALALAWTLVFCATAAAVDFGANDDTGKYAADGGAAFFEQMRESGLRQNVMTVRWLPGSTELAEERFLDAAVPQALEAGIQPLFAVYPYPPSAIEAGHAKPAAFADWLRALAERYPDVKTYIVGNEPNLNTFWRAQGDGTGTVLSGASFGPFLAAGYDALKAVSPSLTVLGVGSSPRGDRRPHAAGKSSPVHFLRSLGDWYRASRRPVRLMDGYSYHPYPNPGDFTVPLTWTYGWPNAGVTELPRIKQALWDAFSGTAQPTTVQGLKLYLDEVGWQVSTSGNEAYTGSENVKVTTEAGQAAIYEQLVRYVVCDPDVAQLNFFGYWDEPDRGGWQAALRRADGTARPAEAAVAAAIESTGGTCRGLLRRWSPLLRPDRAAVEFKAIRNVKAMRKHAFSFVATAAEDVTVRVGLVPARTPAARIGTLLANAGSADAYRRPPKKHFATARAGPTMLAVQLTAKLNPARRALFLSPPFTVAPAPKPATTKLPQP